ncbi:hypothetical protein MKEN_00376000 [Mycena kentingensis (nom. inval.)]|nr:hypothetical protein MKEN_00376000 [Mycena kentingensis (nom. inval.)]
MSGFNFPTTGLAIRPSSDSAYKPPQFNFTHQEQAIRDYGIAGRIWEAAYALNTYLNPPQGVEFDPPFALHATECNRLVELGSGTGLNAAMLSTLLDPERDILLATDLPEARRILFSTISISNFLQVCPLLEQNLASSKGVRVQALAWGNAEHALALPQPLTHIVCSDLVYFPFLLAPLLRSLIQLTTASSDAHIIISYRIRSLPKESPFWSAFGLYFEFSPVLMREPNSEWTRFGTHLPDPTFIFVAQRREESLRWAVPESDADLLSGIGAWGTEAPKSDDTFETLLFMSLE